MGFYIGLNCDQCGSEYTTLRYNRENKKKIEDAATADGWLVSRKSITLCPSCYENFQKQKRPVGRPRKNTDEILGGDNHGK